MKFRTTIIAIYLFISAKRGLSGPKKIYLKIASYYLPFTYSFLKIFFGVLFNNFVNIGDFYII